MKRRPVPKPIGYRQFDLVFIAAWLFAGFLIAKAMAP